MNITYFSLFLGFTDLLIDFSCFGFYNHSFKFSSMLLFFLYSNFSPGRILGGIIRRNQDRLGLFGFVFFPWYLATFSVFSLFFIIIPLPQLTSLASDLALCSSALKQSKQEASPLSIASFERGVSTAAQHPPCSTTHSGNWKCIGGRQEVLNSHLQGWPLGMTALPV